MKNKPTDRIRLSLDITAKVKDQIEALQEESEAPTIVEVFRRALAVYQIVLAQYKANGKVILEHADGSREALRLL